MRPPLKRVDFRPGDKVEVCSKEEGFLGSYYEATVLSRHETGRYVVRYKTLLRDDAVSEPLTKTLFPRDIRPSPPKVYTRGEFSLYQAVDAFDNDGWWSGEITGRIGPHHYYVYFRTTNEEIAYPSSKIRVHHEWVNGDWILSQREPPQPQLQQQNQDQEEQLGQQFN
ncbi:hypothetical protein PIB30_063075 [Stylosanthes scabra]|uniref:Agenet domain-containing protein n=1 Tax=Stylosanthes scabra TaxID=79078 RepID=A0ABU6TL28_9FABA|nr:hypothetical protein [Stylosanthes scabra]